VYLQVVIGVKLVSRDWRRAAAMLGASNSQILWHVVIPGALPHIFAGLRLSLGVSLIVIVSAEFVAAKSGIGYLIWTSWESLVIEKMFVGIIVITLLGVVFNAILKEVERLCIPWRNE